MIFDLLGAVIPGIQPREVPALTSLHLAGGNNWKQGPVMEAIRQAQAVLSEPPII